MISDGEGEFLVKLARNAIETYITHKKIINIPDDVNYSLKEEMGAFVTLNRDGDLRGCIGYPEPVKPLAQAVVEVAISAATQDPRFPPVTATELEEIQVEVSVLTKPELVEVRKPAEYLEKVEVGRDGLIVEKGMYRGLLLPQVPVEWNWDIGDFLANTCIKAGLSPDCWLEEGVKLYSFQSQIFSE
ncbi:TIGR00296 family protein [Methanobacterium sp.]|uniref:TIGR00296 family protein n=1 Tax=Methanobacterium sp. TaxID=2164 RepID=UPI002AB9F9CE|nr:TIGR00296 family protein [Methanobacterium sp.]MDY9922217.1 TIGR00296 family protein [Methanobacterium sp.]